MRCHGASMAGVPRIRGTRAGQRESEALRGRKAAAWCSARAAGPRTILLRQSVWQALLSIRGEADPSDAVFRSRRGGGALDPSQVRRIVLLGSPEGRFRTGGFPALDAPLCHALDHSAPIHLVQATLGHATVATTGRYLHARPSESSGFYLPD